MVFEFTTNILKIFLCQLTALLVYFSLGISILSFEVLYTTDFQRPQRKKSAGVKPDDLGGNSIGSRRPIHYPENSRFSS